METFVNELLSVNNQIDELVEKRKTLVHDACEKILGVVMKKMDWTRKQIYYSRVEYSDIDEAVMIDVRVDVDCGARYVFSLKCNHLSLLFREDFSKHNC